MRLIGQKVDLTAGLGGWSFFGTHCILCLKDTNADHFADDTFIIYNSKKLKTLETVVNTELKQVVKWLKLNKLSLNTGKTELIFFHSKRHLLSYDEISIKFNGIKLKPVFVSSELFK